MPSSGRTLNTHETLAVNTSLCKLKVNESLESIELWGKIIGTQKDYIILKSCSFDQSISKVFYWSNDGGASFARLTKPDKFAVKEAAGIRSMFTGNPARKLSQPVTSESKLDTENPIQTSLSSTSTPPAESKARVLSELEHLAVSVYAITDSCDVVPTGSFYMTATKEIAEDAAFAGVALKDLFDLSKYQLFRKPSSASTITTIAKHQINQNRGNLTELFDTLDQQEKGIWCFLKRNNGLQAVLRNLR